MRIETRKIGDVLLVAMAGRLDSVTAGEAGDRLTEVAKGPDRQVVLGLSGLGYVSSAGLRAILLCAKLLQSHGGELRIGGATGHVLAVLDTSGFDSLLRLYPTEDAAVASFAAG